ncbi:succinate--CoA ligase subunit alpha [Alkalilacustris brevis]|uniref:succinate--CoA ligase subunit alpha n=1 Tax=Alkalilacustris brevis TaxID=2026338 RepID=UPI0013901059|nr:succinate--CoA ligase subunit alpha [Alkalilacustris brevis]
MLDAVLGPAPQDIPVIVQGATGRVAQNHVRLMRDYGTRIVAGISRSTRTPRIDEIPIYTDTARAVAETGARASVIMVPPLSVLDAISEALEAGLKLVVTVTEGVPAHDALRAHALVRAAGACWIGASTPGLAVPGRLKMGFLPDVALAPGPVAIWSKSGTLSYESGLRLVQHGLGQSAWIGVGGDAIKGTRFADLVEPFRNHAATRAVLVIGEIGGTEEEELAETLAQTPLGKPVHALIAGASAPEGQAMGHAGAMVMGNRGSHASKRAALMAAGVRVHDRIGTMIDAITTDIRKGQQ